MTGWSGLNMKTSRITRIAANGIPTDKPHRTGCRRFQSSYLFNHTLRTCPVERTPKPGVTSLADQPLPQGFVVLIDVHPGGGRHMRPVAETGGTPAPPGSADLDRPSALTAGRRRLHGWPVPRGRVAKPCRVAGATGRALAFTGAEEYPWAHQGRGTKMSCANRAAPLVSGITYDALRGRCDGLGYRTHVGLLTAPTRSLEVRRRNRIRRAVMAGRPVEDPSDVGFALSYGHWALRLYRIAAVVFFVFGLAGVLIGAFQSARSFGNLLEGSALLLLSGAWCLTAFKARRSIRLNEAFGK
jgi:hypothetical protein